MRRDQRGMTQEKAAAEAEARIKAEEELQAQRKIDSKDLAGETIRRELAERKCCLSAYRIALIPRRDHRHTARCGRY